MTRPRRLILAASIGLLLAAALHFWAKSEEFEDRWTWNYAKGRQLRVISINGRLILMASKGGVAWWGGHSSSHYTPRELQVYESGRHFIGFGFYAGSTPATMSAKPGSISFVSVPFAYLCVSLIAFAVLWRRRVMASTRRWSASRCPSCGYDIRESADRCPECGADIGPYSVWDPWEQA